MPKMTGSAVRWRPRRARAAVRALTRSATRERDQFLEVAGDWQRLRSASDRRSCASARAISSA